MYFTLHLGSLLSKSKYACTDVQKKRDFPKNTTLPPSTKSRPIFNDYQSQSKHKVNKKKSSASCQVHFIYLFLKNNSVFHVPKTFEILK